jgi:uncharacterized protein YoxC
VSVVEVASLIVAIAVVVAAVFLITAVNNLNNTLAKLEDTAHQLRDEGIGAFRELRQLVADADAELDKVDLVLDRADQATTHIAETSRRTHEAVQDPVIRTIAVASGTGRVARNLFGRKKAKESTPLPQASSNNTIDLVDPARPQVNGGDEPADTAGARRRFRR